MICDLVIEFTSTKSHINDSAIIGIMNAQIKGTAFFFLPSTLLLLRGFANIANWHQYCAAKFAGMGMGLSSASGVMCLN